MNNKHLVRDLEKQGFLVTNKGKHFKAYPPDKTKPFIVFACTPSDWRGVRNAISYLKKVGYKPND